MGKWASRNTCWKIQAFENIFDTLKREIKEETGLDVVEILGDELKRIIAETPQSLYPMHIGTLEKYVNIMAIIYKSKPQEFTFT